MPPSLCVTIRARTVRARATARRARVALGTVVVNPSNSYCIAHFIMNQGYEWVGGSSELEESGVGQWVRDKSGFRTVGPVGCDSRWETKCPQGAEERNPGYCVRARAVAVAAGARRDGAGGAHCQAAEREL